MTGRVFRPVLLYPVYFFLSNAGLTAYTLR